MIKKVIRKIFKVFGYEIVKLEKKRGWGIHHLAQLSNAHTIVDVGSAYGTPALYHAYPNAKIVIFEPLSIYEESLKKFEKTYDCTIYQYGVGSTYQKKKINFDSKNPERSSFLNRSNNFKNKSTIYDTEQKFELYPLDAFLQEKALSKPPYLLKIDTECFEMEVLRGAKEFLKYTETIIVETSVKNRFNNSYRFEELVQELVKEDFYLFDILSIHYRKSRLGANFVDLVFLKDNHE